MGGKRERWKLLAERNHKDLFNILLKGQSSELTEFRGLSEERMERY